MSKLNEELSLGNSTIWIKGKKVENLKKELINNLTTNYKLVQLRIKRMNTVTTYNTIYIYRISQTKQPITPVYLYSSKKMRNYISQHSKIRNIRQKESQIKT